MRRHSAVIFFIILAFAAMYLIADNIFSAFTENSADYAQSAALTVKVKSVEKKDDHINIFTRNTVISYWNHDGAENFEPGDILYIEGTVSPVRDLESGYAKYLRSRGYNYMIKPDIIRYEKSIKGSSYLIYKNKEKLSVFIDNLYKADAPFVKALLYGDKSEIDKENLDILSSSGVIHLIAISGFHIGLVALLISGMLKKLPALPRYMIVMIIIIFYVIFTGARPSSVRAAFFYLLYIISISRCERYDMMSCGFLLSSVFISLNPYILYDAGFTLSFMAVFSIGMFYDKINFVLRHLKLIPYITQVMAMTISSIILTSPLTYYYFGRISLVSIPANLISVPLVTLLYPFMILSLIFETLAGAGRFFSYPVIYLLQIFRNSNTYITKFRFSYMDFENPEFYKVVLVYSVLLIIYILFHNYRLKENSNDLQGFDKQY